MKLPLSVKIRLALILGISVLLFATFGWSFAQPSDPTGALTLVNHHQPLRLVFFTIILALVTTALALLIAGKYAGYLAPLAVPAGLSAWSVQTSSIKALFPEHFSAGGFYPLIGDVIFWAFLVMLGHLITTFYVQRKLSLDNQSGPPNNSPSLINSPRDRHPHIKPLVLNIVAVIFSCLIALLLLMIFVQSGSAMLLLNDQRIIPVATSPVVGQTIFAVGAAFLLATFAAHQLFGGTIRIYLLAPSLAAVFAYLCIAQSSGLTLVINSTSAPFIPFYLRFSLILPVQYVAVGSLGVFTGFWLSINTLYLRRHSVSAAEK